MKFRAFPGHLAVLKQLGTLRKQISFNVSFQREEFAGEVGGEQWLLLSGAHSDGRLADSISPDQAICKTNLFHSRHRVQYFPTLGKLFQAETAPIR